MTVQADAPGRSATAGRGWYSRSPEDVADSLGAVPSAGLTATRAAELLSANGPNKLPEELFGEFVLAVGVTQLDMFRRLLGTSQPNLREFGWALVPAIVLLVLWELGKLIARRSASVSRR